MVLGLEPLRPVPFETMGELTMRWSVLLILVGVSPSVFADCTAKQKADMVKLGMSIEEIRAECGADAPNTQVGQPVVININNNQSTTAATDPGRANLPAADAGTGDDKRFGFGLRTVDFVDDFGARMAGRGYALQLMPHKNFGLRYSFAALEAGHSQYAFTETTLLLSSNSNSSGLSLNFGWSPSFSIGAAEGSAKSLGLAITIGSARFGYEATAVDFGGWGAAMNTMELSILL